MQQRRSLVQGRARPRPLRSTRAREHLIHLRRRARLKRALRSVPSARVQRLARRPRRGRPPRAVHAVPQRSTRLRDVRVKTLVILPPIANVTNARARASPPRVHGVRIRARSPAAPPRARAARVDAVASLARAHAGARSIDDVDRWRKNSTDRFLVARVDVRRRARARARARGRPAVDATGTLVRVRMGFS